MSKIPENATIPQIGRLAKVAANKIRKHIKTSGIKPVNKTGVKLYNVGDVLFSVAENRKLDNDNSYARSSVKEEKTRLECGLLALKLKHEQGRLVDIEAAKMLLNEVAAIYAAGLEAMPGRMAAELAGIESPGEVKDCLFAEIRRIRVSTAEKLRGFGVNSETCN